MIVQLARHVLQWEKVRILACQQNAQVTVTQGVLTLQSDVQVVSSPADSARRIFFLLDAAWVRSRAERPSVSYTKVTSKVLRAGHNLQPNCHPPSSELAPRRIASSVGPEPRARS